MLLSKRDECLSLIFFGFCGHFFEKCFKYAPYLLAACSKRNKVTAVYRKIPDREAELLFEILSDRFLKTGVKYAERFCTSERFLDELSARAYKSSRINLGSLKFSGEPFGNSHRV